MIEVAKATRGLKVLDVERIILDVPFRERNRPWNELIIGQWRIIEVIRVTTNDPEVVGYGEAILDYCYAQVPEEAIARVRGRNPADMMADDKLGQGLQMALYDAAGKALGVPMRRLLGLPEVRDECPLGWWNTKMPPEVLAEEARDAVREGYRSHKFKARPWFDVHEQVAAIVAVTPTDFTLDVDWNEMLREASAAAPVLVELEGSGRIGIFETPIPHADLAGYRSLRAHVTRPLADHFLDVPHSPGLDADPLDGYVLAWQGISGMLKSGAAAALANRPFFLQMCGTGIMTACALQLGAVLTHARWPHITVMNTFAEDLLRAPLAIAHGFARVPEGPGLGVEIDEKALQRLAIAGPTTVAYPRLLLTIEWPNGRRRSYASAEQMWADCLAGNVLPQERGVKLCVERDDGSPGFDDLHRRCAVSPLTRS